MQFADVLHLDTHGTDTFMGRGPRYPWGGLYGGQIVAQALQAATLTVEDRYRVHSLHAYFVRRGDHTEPIRFEVDRVRNGRSFTTRNVIARQAVGAILSLSASFCIDEEGPEVQTVVMPDVPPPDGLPSEVWSEMFDRRWVPGGRRQGRALAWMRMTQAVGDGSGAQAVALAYLSDDLPTDAVATLFPGAPSLEEFEGAFWSASLDHAIWFHRPLRAEDWHLHEFNCHGMLGSRGLSIGNVFTAAGVHVATITQEVLLRDARGHRGGQAPPG